MAARIASASLWHERWLEFISNIPEGLKNELLDKLGTEKLEHRDRQIIAVLSAVADVALAQDVFSRLCVLRHKVDSSRPIDQIQAAIIRQLEDLFRLIPSGTAVDSISNLFSQDFDPTEFRVITELFSRVGREEADLRGDLPETLRQGLRGYLKSGVSFASSQPDPSGQLLANLASALARVGDPVDMVDLVELIHADLKRLKHIRQGQRAHGVMGWGMWHLQAVMSLDRDRAETALLPLLKRGRIRCRCRQILAAPSHD